MPTYEYKCEKCNQTFDAFQSMNDEAYARLPTRNCAGKRFGAKAKSNV